MNPARWDAIQGLFKQVVDAPDAERDVMLRRAGEIDPELEAEVRALLAADADTGSLLDGVAADAVNLLEELTQEGEQVGPYRLVHLLGTGGMGAVYLAERTDGVFSQRVAVKLIKRGMDSERILRRFRSERQILARLQHPNIATLLDGGVTDRGTPWFAMEYVEGEPIDRYCDRNRLPIDARLELFNTVCRAVLYAHANLIVHRDLKPANILVSADSSGEPQVKLLDFGIARVLGGNGEEEGDLTRTGGQVMTPAYASPEQVRGEPVGTSTDVYSLGVVLYELLTGRMPYDSLSHDAALTEEPRRPSTVVRTGGTGGTGGAGITFAETEAIGRSRATQPDRLRRLLSGDLDVICLTALRKESDRRYASVEALAGDVRRHLDGLPIAARPDTRAYRVAKFVRRHRAGVLATAAVVLVAVTAGIALSLQQAETARQRDAAQREAAKAVAVAGFLERVFTMSDPSEAKGNVITAQALLAEGARRIDAELADQPDVQAQLLEILSRVHMNLGQYEDALPMMERLLALRRRQFGELSSEYGSSLSDLGSLLRRMGRYGEAEAYNRQALGVARAVLGEKHRYVAIALNNLAISIDNQDRHAEAESLHREALAMQRELFDGDHLDLAQSLNNLAVTLEKQDALEEAEAVHREAFSMYRSVLGDTHAFVAGAMTNLASIVGSMGRYDEAIELNRDALALNRVLHGDAHPDIAYTLNNLAFQLSRAGHHAEAAGLHREALAMRRSLLDPDHPVIGESLENLANTLAAMDSLAGAQALMQQAIAIYEAGGPATRPSLEAAQLRLAQLRTPR